MPAAARPPQSTLRLRIAGRVQGVGFREAMRAEALGRGVNGWVRNRTDGSVEAVLQGPRDSVDAVRAWAQRGPPAARVTQVETLPVSPELDRSYAGFERWPSA